MKNILLLLPSLTVGGMERMAVTLANKLDSLGFSVTVMILDDITELQTELSNNIRLIRKPYKNHFGKKLPYIRHKYYDDGMWETRATPRQLYEYYVGKEEFDVEIAFFRGLCVKIISGSTNQNAVRLAWVHSDFRRARGYQNNFRSINEVRDAYVRFDRVVCVSNEAKTGFIETIGDAGNLTTIYNMLPVEKIKS
ncbi:MAG: glycosyltransferase, partial [Ruminococcus sp.]|nr:glycosyltransferase [Ruminococcus sp.]